jgi:mono/diheme cytochrome c family protein
MQQHKKYEWHVPFMKTGLAVAVVMSLGAGGAARAQSGPAVLFPEMNEQELRGKHIYDESAGDVGCQMCHGPLGNGSIEQGAPGIKGVVRSAFDSALAGAVPMMEFFTLSQKEQEDVYAYLQVLNKVEVLTYDPEATEGKKIYEELAGGVGCQACHGLDAAGIIGPDIRGKDPVAIMAAMKAVPDMGIIELTEAQVDQVAAYLRQLHEAESH